MGTSPPSLLMSLSPRVGESFSLRKILLPFLVAVGLGHPVVGRRALLLLARPVCFGQFRSLSFPSRSLLGMMSPLLGAAVAAVLRLRSLGSSRTLTRSRSLLLRLGSGRLAVPVRAFLRHPLVLQVLRFLWPLVPTPVLMQRAGSIGSMLLVLRPQLLLRSSCLLPPSRLRPACLGGSDPWVPVLTLSLLVLPRPPLP